MRTTTVARLGLMCVTWGLLQEPGLAQPRPVTHVIVTSPTRDVRPLNVDADFDTILKEFQFQWDRRRPYSTCDKQPRTVISGTIPTDRLVAMRQKLSAAQRPEFRIFDDPMVLPIYTELCDYAQRDYGERQARQAAGLNLAGLEHGKQVVVAIVDTGVDIPSVTGVFTQVKPNATFSWRDPLIKKNALGDPHATMCAYVASMAAPAIELADVRITGRASSFADAYLYLWDAWEKNKGSRKALVVSTSWEFPRVLDPLFDPKDTLAYGTEHPLLSNVRCLTSAGVDVVFAAGNGGACEAAQSRAVGSITRPNAMGEAITIAAVDAAKVRLGDSGQGGAAAPAKPDLSAFGSLILQNGLPARNTSAATAFAAGVIASLRSLPGWSAAERSTAAVRACLGQHADKEVQMATTKGVAAFRLNAHSIDFGYGVVRFDKDVHTWKEECGKPAHATP